jgi:uncharacterized hydrophobic protein (TIGR00341 family)
MRLVQALLPVGAREQVLDALRERSVDFALSGESSAGDFPSMVSIPVETEDVEEILEILRDAGVERDGYIVVQDAEAIVSERFGDDRLEKGESTDRLISPDELRARMRNELHELDDYLLLTVVSAVLAAAGLLLDSPTIITGSMVVAPLLGPPVALSVGSVTGDGDLVEKAVQRQIAGLLVGVAGATGFALLVQQVIAAEIPFASLNQIAEFSEPTALALVVALAAGVAAGLSLTAGISGALVGVAVASAIIPPVASLSIGLAYGRLDIAVGALVLLLVNVFSINLMCLVTLWFREYRPVRFLQRRRAREYLTKEIAVLVVGILLVSSFVGVATAQHRQNAQFEQTVTEFVSETDARVLEIEFQYQTEPLFNEPRAVIIHASDVPPGYAERLHVRILRETGIDVTVAVYEPSSIATAGAGETDPRSARSATATRADDRGQSLREGGMSGSNPTAFTARSSTSSTFSPVSTLM